MDSFHQHPPATHQPLTAQSGMPAAGSHPQEANSDWTTVLFDLRRSVSNLVLFVLESMPVPWLFPVAASNSAACGSGESGGSSSSSGGEALPSLSAQNCAVHSEASDSANSTGSTSAEPPGIDTLDAFLEDWLTRGEQNAGPKMKRSGPQHRERPAAQHASSKKSVLACSTTAPAPAPAPAAANPTRKKPAAPTTKRRAAATGAALDDLVRQALV